LANNLLDCDVFINPSFVESFSASAVEALSLGVPSLLAYSGAMPGFSEKVRVAEYYNPLDYFDAAAKTLELVNNKEKAESLGGNASAYIRDLCAPGSVCKCQLDIYSNVLGEIGNETI
jgi:glycosyltransferase involved in cell wall biosynthesis